MAHSAELTTKQRRFVAALLAGQGIGAATEAAGVKSRSTAYRWLAQEAVRAELRERSGAIMVANQARLSRLLDLALDVHEAACRGERVTGSQRWGATGIARHVVRLVELLSLEARVTALEQRGKG